MNTTNNSNLPITPERFWAALSSSLNKKWNSEKVDEFWFNDRFKRTEFMSQTIENLDREFNCTSAREYSQRIDVSFFDQNDKGGPWSEWAREAAIEIENDDYWRENEVCKLMEINAGIKVLVAYVQGVEALDSFWEKLPGIYKSRKYLTQPCNWLFVFGIFGKDDWDFKAYKFDGEHFDITGKDRTRPLPI